MTCVAAHAPRPPLLNGVSNAKSPIKIFVSLFEVWHKVVFIGIYYFSGISRNLLAIILARFLGRYSFEVSITRSVGFIKSKV